MDRRSWRLTGFNLSIVPRWVWALVAGAAIVLTAVAALSGGGGGNYSDRVESYMRNELGYPVACSKSSDVDYSCTTTGLLSNQPDPNGESYDVTVNPDSGEVENYSVSSFGGGF
jgi:hypothetical protein